MKKRKKISEIEEELAEPLETYLRRRYIDQRISTVQIGREIGLRSGTIYRWLRGYGISTRNNSESKLPADIIAPTKEELTKLYIDQRMSANQIGREIGVNPLVVYHWLRKHNIPIRNNSEARLPAGVTPPTKEELTKLYIDQRMSAPQIAQEIGVNPISVYLWLRKHKIPIRNRSEANLPGGALLNKENLTKLYVDQRMSAPQIAQEIGVNTKTVYYWLTEHEIQIRGSRNNNKAFITFVRQDRTIQQLSALALASGDNCVDIEALISEIYEGKFRSRQQLHKLLQDNRDDIAVLVQEGMTNLGAYLGHFHLGDRTIIPLLLGEALVSLPEEKITPTLEQRLVHILRSVYGPRFNEHPEETLVEIQGKADVIQGKARSLYLLLQQHYKETLDLRDLLE